jgi:hypothetical protein
MMRVGHDDSRFAQPVVVHEGFVPVLQRLSADAAHLFGSPSTRLVPVSYQERPFSHLLCVRVSRPEGGGPDPHVFVKIFKPKPVDRGVERMRERVVHDFETTRRIHDLLAPWSDLGAVRPIACYPDHLAVVTERADGSTLLDHLHQHGSWFPAAEMRAQLEDTLATVGRWLRVFQSADRSTGRLSIDSLCDYVDVRLNRLVQHAPGFTDADRARVLEHLHWLGEQASPGELAEVPVHADVAFGNILIAGPRVVLLDFAMATRGSCLHDASRLHMQLELLLAKPRFRPHVIHGLQQALLHGLDPSLTSDRPFFRFLLILHRINHLTTLSAGTHVFPGSAFNTLVRRLHRRWLARELERR